MIGGATRTLIIPIAYAFCITKGVAQKGVNKGANVKPVFRVYGGRALVFSDYHTHDDVIK